MNWWHYLLLVNIYLVLFYGFYALLLRKETFFQLNRIYLVAAALLSFIIPIIQADWVKKLFITEEVHYRIYGQASVNIYSIHPMASSPVTVGQLLTLLYVGGIVFLTGRLALQLIRVNKILKTPEPSAAYAFFNKINLGENALDQQAVLAHEQVHARQLHSLDVLLIETVMIVNWFNPVVYLYRFAIKHIHEYIADQQVIKIGADKAEYAMLLVSQTFNAPASGLVSAFSGSLLKKRIKMLQKDRSKRIVLFKYMLSAPLFGLMLILSSATIEDNKAINLIQRHASALFDKSAKSVINNIVSPDDEVMADHSEISGEDFQDRTIYEKVDKVPEFPGGLNRFNFFLAAGIHYPAAAKEKNITGKVYVQFVVEPNGFVTNVRAVKSPSPLLSAEAVRVIKSSPKWQPGVLKGKNVRTYYTVPINFAMNASALLTRDNLAKPRQVTVTPQASSAPVVEQEKIYEAVEVEPSFPGGPDAFSRFLSATVRFPAIDRQNNVTGRAYVTFVVEKDGSLSNVRAVRGPSETIMTEAVRGVSLSPKWSPGLQGGVPVRVNYTVPVNFTLNDNIIPSRGTGSLRAHTTVGGEPVYEAVEKEPSFPGGVEAFNRFLANTIKYPAIDRDNNVTGKVYVSFVVEKDGSLSNVKAVRGPSQTTRDEAEHAVAMSPKWNPGIQNGRLVRVSYTVPVNFTLTSDKNDLTTFSKENIEVKWMKVNSPVPFNQAVILVDGKELKGGLNSINVNEIKSVTILRGDEAVKKYGDKAKNGVILIELK